MSLRSNLRGLLIAAAIAIPMFTLPHAQAQIHIGIGINIGVPPPALPVYVQPAIPCDGYIWTPGYWAYGDAGYFWVPGTWVLAPQPGYLWTPGYWGFEGGYYGWHGGYWGPHVGFYGGVNYGFGYGGVGFFGGEWRGGHFFYNGAVANFGGGFHPVNVYVDRDVVVHNTIVNVNHTSFNGPGGIDRRPGPDEQRFSNEHHIEPTGAQLQHQNFAAQDRSQLASVNHGRPATMAAANPGAYHQVAQQHAQSQPISAADRSSGKNFNPNDRSANQDQRISNGVRSGQLNEGQAARDNQRQANTDQEIHNDRTANGGKLTQPERQQVNKQQNAQSRQIKNQKQKNDKAPKEPK
jgi:WXXGXW repeat (2 copies)